MPIVILLGLIEAKLRMIPNNYKYKHEWMIANQSHVQILNFGSSHGYNGIKPNLFSLTAFNLAFTSQSLKYDKFLYDTYAVQCDSLKYLILPISYFTLRTNMETSVEHWRIRGYCIYMDCPYHRYEPFYNLEIISKDKICSIFDVMLHNITFITCDLFGACSDSKMESRNKDWQKTGAIACARHTNNAVDYVEENVQYLQDIINDCMKRKIKVIILTTPTHESYYELLESTQLTEMKEICSRYDDEYENVVYLNWLKHDSFTDEDFFDADHLNEYGADKLTRMLDQYIMNWR